MYKHILEQAGNINWMAIAALLTFVTVFLLVLIMVAKKDPAYIHKMANMPLEDNPSAQPEIEDYHAK